MYCKMCGTENSDGAKFCRKCGNGLVLMKPATAETKTEKTKTEEIKTKAPKGVKCPECGAVNTNDNKFCKKCGASLAVKVKKKLSIMPVIAVVLSAIVIVAIIILLFAIKSEWIELPSWMGGSEGSSNHRIAHSKDGELVDENGDVIVDFEKVWEVADDNPITDEMLSNPHILEDSQAVVYDLIALDYEPGDRADASDWEGVYLEEILSKPRAEQKVTNTTVYDETSMVYDTWTIYQNEDGIIYRVQRREPHYDGDEETFVDYFYYLDGSPYMIYHRDASVLVPAAMTTNLPGAWLEFSNDVLVRSRVVVDECLKDSRTTIFPIEYPSYEQFDYNKAPKVVQNQYDQFEIQWLNEAYNVINVANLVIKNGNVRQLTGHIVDEAGNGVEGVQVALQYMENGEIVGLKDTGLAGFYDFGNITYDGKYRLYVKGQDGQRDAYFYDINADSENNLISLDPIVLHADSSELYPVSFELVYPYAMAINAEETMPEDFEVTFRRNYNNYEGEIVYSLKTDENNELGSIELPAGTYTAQVNAMGYQSIYANIEVGSGSEVLRQLHMIPELSNGQVAVVAEWNNTDRDYDMTVFSSNRGSDGYMEHIGGVTKKDSKGNKIISDENPGMEAALLSTDASSEFSVYIDWYNLSSRPGSLAQSEYSIDAINNSRETVKVSVYYWDGRQYKYSTELDNSGYVNAACRIFADKSTYLSDWAFSASGIEFWRYAKNGDLEIAKSKYMDYLTDECSVDDAFALAEFDDFDIPVLLVSYDVFNKKNRAQEFITRDGREVTAVYYDKESDSIRYLDEYTDRTLWFGNNYLFQNSPAIRYNQLRADLS